MADINVNFKKPHQNVQEIKATDKDVSKQKEGGLTVFIVIIVAFIIVFFILVTNFVNIRMKEINTSLNYISKVQEGNQSIHMLLKYFQILKKTKNIGKEGVEEEVVDPLEGRKISFSSSEDEKIVKEGILDKMTRYLINGIRFFMGKKGRNQNKSFLEDRQLREAYAYELQQKYTAALEIYDGILPTAENQPKLKSYLLLHTAFCTAAQGGNKIQDGIDQFKELLEYNNSLPKDERDKDSVKIALQLLSLLNEIKKRIESVKGEKDLLKRGRLLINLTQFQEGVETLNQFVSQESRDHDQAYYYMGTASEGIGDYERASEVYKRVVNDFKGSQWANYASIRIADLIDRGLIEEDEEIENIIEENVDEETLNEIKSISQEDATEEEYDTTVIPTINTNEMVADLESYTTTVDENYNEIKEDLDIQEDENETETLIVQEEEKEEPEEEIVATTDTEEARKQIEEEKKRLEEEEKKRQEEEEKKRQEEEEKLADEERRKQLEQNDSLIEKARIEVAKETEESLSSAESLLGQVSEPSENQNSSISGLRDQIAKVRQKLKDEKNKKADEEKATALISKAQGQIGNEQYDAAKSTLNEASSLQITDSQKSQISDLLSQIEDKKSQKADEKKADSLISKAQGQISSGQYEGAKSSLNTALSLQITDSQKSQIDSLLTQIEDKKNEEQRQKELKKIDSLISAARSSYSSDNFEKAINYLDQTETVGSGPSDSQRISINSLRDQIRNAENKLQSEQRKVSEAINDARMLMGQAKYDEALNKINSVSSLSKTPAQREEISDLIDQITSQRDQMLYDNVKSRLKKIKDSVENRSMEQDLSRVLTRAVSDLERLMTDINNAPNPSMFNSEKSQISRLIREYEDRRNEEFGENVIDDILAQNKREGSIFILKNGEKINGEIIYLNEKVRILRLKRKDTGTNINLRFDQLEEKSLEKAKKIYEMQN